MAQALLRPCEVMGDFHRPCTSCPLRRFGFCLWRIIPSGSPGFVFSRCSPTYLCAYSGVTSFRFLFSNLFTARLEARGKEGGNEKGRKGAIPRQLAACSRCIAVPGTAAPCCKARAGMKGREAKQRHGEGHNAGFVEGRKVEGRERQRAR